MLSFERPRILVIVLSVLMALVISGFIYLFAIQSPLSGKRDLGLLLILFLFLFGLFVWLIPILRSKLLLLRSGVRVFFILFSIVCGFWLANGVNTRLPIFIFSLPTIKLEIIATGAKNPLARGTDVHITDFHTGITEVSFNEFKQTGIWEKIGKKLRSSRNQPAALVWMGRPYDSASLKFMQSPSAGFVKVNINGKDRFVDLYSPVNQEIWITFEAPVPQYVYLLRYFIVGLSFSMFIFFFTLLLGVRKESFVCES